MPTNEDYKEYKQGRYEAIEDCESHLLLAFCGLGSYREFEDLKYDVKMLLDVAKGIKRGIQDDE